MRRLLSSAPSFPFSRSLISRQEYIAAGGKPTIAMELVDRQSQEHGLSLVNHLVNFQCLVDLRDLMSDFKYAVYT